MAVESFLSPPFTDTQEVQPVSVEYVVEASLTCSVDTANDRPDLVIHLASPSVAVDGGEPGTARWDVYFGGDEFVVLFLRWPPDSVLCST